jgi:hypothetical protein
MNSAKKNYPILETILAIRSSIGDGLSDDELTRLLRTTLLSEAGFSFLSFSRGWVTLTVPDQDLTNWYPEQGWLAPAKEKVARGIAGKYELSLFEPLDTVTNIWQPVRDPDIAHHHVEMSDRWQTVIVAHPQYLKVRVLGRNGPYRYDWEAYCPMVLGPEILRDLSELYSEA